MEDDGPALDAVVGTDGLDAAGNEEDGAAAPLPGVPEEDPGTTADDGQLYEDPAALDEDGTYNSAEDVSLYLYTYGRLPENYITKNEARDLGWSGGSVEKYAPGCAIGGDKFGNREGVLPDGKYLECDIDTIGQDSRGAKRLVYSDDGRIYYTEDHYETFTLLYGEE
ncbi:MAG: ribonuclease [Oscillospiraceae bacterium]|nr:ribonuclease [Oscillospiraceae bacterium]